MNNIFRKLIPLKMCIEIVKVAIQYAKDSKINFGAMILVGIPNDADLMTWCWTI